MPYLFPPSFCHLCFYLWKQTLLFWDFCLFIFNGLKNLIQDLGKMGAKYQGKVKTQHFAVFLISWLLQFITQISLFCKPDFGMQSHGQGAAMPPWH